MAARKVPPHLENPIDNVMYALADRTSPFFHDTGHTPNTLTTYSAIFGVGALWALFEKRFWVFATLWTLAYFFDCADGYFARKYNMASKNGDLYDHIKDKIVLAGWAAILWLKFKASWTSAAVFAIASSLVAVHVGCQQNWYKQVGRPTTEDEVTDVYEGLCPQQEALTWTRFFGPGTLQLVILAVTFHAIG